MATPEEIFKQVFAAEYAGLSRYALTFMQDSHLAEDVVQDTFIRIWETKQELLTSPDVRFYLVTAVRNNCISALRKQKRAAVDYTEDAPEGEPEPFLTAMQHREDATERSRKIAAALDALPPKCREVFLLVKLNGLSYKQTADSLGISVKTVEAQMGKALKTFREGAFAVMLLLLTTASFVNHCGAVGVALLKSVLP